MPGINIRITGRFPLTVLVVMCAVLLVTAAGCGLFEPREAQAPGGSDRVSFAPANDASGIFANLRSGIENLAQGANYERTLAENFDFVPLVSDADLLGNVFDDWSKQVETDVLQLMLAESKETDVNFERSENINENEYVQFRVTYELKLTSKANNVETTYKGIAHFDVRRNGGIWELEKWEEVEPVEGFTTWGYHKGTLRGKLES